MSADLRALISAEKGKTAVLLGAGLLGLEACFCLEQPLGCEDKIAVNSTLATSFQLTNKSFVTSLRAQTASRRMVCSPYSTISVLAAFKASAGARVS